MATHKKHKNKTQRRQQQKQQQDKVRQQETGLTDVSDPYRHRFTKSTRVDGPTVSPRCGDDDPLIGVFSAALRQRSIRADDVLWLACFALTMLLLDVPRVLLFNQRIQRSYLSGSGACALICCALAFHLRVIARLFERFAVRNLVVVRVLFVGCLIGAAGMFCAAVWPVYHIWAAYIAVVSTFTFLAVIAVI